MRAKITIVFETHGSGATDQHNDWSSSLLERICTLLDIPEEPEPGREDEYPLVTFDVVAVEKLAEKTGVRIMVDRDRMKAQASLDEARKNVDFFGYLLRLFV